MRVAAIIPALNEEFTIGKVLEAVRQSPLVQDIIVVNDGSYDNTSAIAKARGVTVLDLPQNHGKGGAVTAGVRLTKAEVFLFLDADLVGLTADHISALLEPVLKQKQVMSLGIIDRGKFWTRLTFFLKRREAPWMTLTGQRALKRSLFTKIALQKRQDYGLELALNEYCRTHDLPVAMVELPGLSHTIKEKKWGLWKGLQARFAMFINVIASFMRLQSSALTQKSKLKTQNHNSKIKSDNS